MRQFSTAQAQTTTGAAEVHHDVNVPLDVDKATPQELHQSPIARKLRERYPNIKIARLQKVFYTLDLDRDIVPQEEKLINEYGFLKEEINFIMRYNPKFILPEQYQAS